MCTVCNLFVLCHFILFAVTTITEQEQLNNDLTLNQSINLFTYIKAATNTLTYSSLYTVVIKQLTTLGLLLTIHRYAYLILLRSTADIMEEQMDSRPQRQFSYNRNKILTF